MRKKTVKAQLIPAVLTAGMALPCAAGSVELVFELDAGSAGWIARDHPLTLTASRPLEADEGRLAILVGPADLTDLFVLRGTRLQMTTGLLELAPGEQDVVVFAVSDENHWRELARLPIRVLTDRGFERRTGTRQLDLQGSSLLEQRDRPRAEARNGENEATLSAQLGGELERAGWRFAGQMHAVGVTQDEKALRFATEGSGAPRVDLAAYSLRLDRPGEARAYVELGHVSHAQHRFILPGFASRGLVAGIPLGHGGALSVANVNGSSLVGWRNLSGLADRDHRISSASVGFELDPARPGALRVDVDFLDGSLLPLSSFNAGSVTDRETNRAWGARIAGATPAGRLRGEVGYARSRFDNPFDASLAQGIELVPVVREERDARYAAATWNLLQNRALTATHSADLSLSARHEHIAPQYATVAAPIQSDVEQNAVDLTARLGPVQVQMSHGASRDNLARIASILTTRTRRQQASLVAPLGSLLAGLADEVPWLPVASVNFERTHQFGTGIPVNSGFNASHVPDQVSARQALGLDWRGARWGLTYRADHVEQDNRQPGRAFADFQTLVHSGSVSFAVRPGLDLSLDASRERAHAAETGQVDRTRNVGAGFAWNPFGRLHLSAAGGFSRAHDEPLTSRNRSTWLDASLTWNVEWRTTGRANVRGQLFLRYSDLGQRSHDRLFDFELDTRNRSLVGGLNLSFL